MLAQGRQGPGVDPSTGGKKNKQQQIRQHATATKQLPIVGWEWQRMSIVTTLRKCRQESYKFEADLSYIVRTCVSEYLFTLCSGLNVIPALGPRDFFLPHVIV